MDIVKEEYYDLIFKILQDGFSEFSIRKYEKIGIDKLNLENSIYLYKGSAEIEPD